jgi:hypothetical protein
MLGPFFPGPNFSKTKPKNLPVPFLFEVVKIKDRFVMVALLKCGYKYRVSLSDVATSKKKKVGVKSFFTLSKLKCGILKKRTFD